MIDILSFYFAVIAVGSLAWVLYYRTRKTEQEEHDASVLGVLLVTLLTLGSTFFFSLFIALALHRLDKNTENFFSKATY